jgi:hypothetical protein
MDFVKELHTLEVFLEKEDSDLSFNLISYLLY